MKNPHEMQSFGSLIKATPTAAFPVVQPTVETVCARLSSAPTAKLMFPAPLMQDGRRQTVLCMASLTSHLTRFRSQTTNGIQQRQFFSNIGHHLISTSRLARWMLVQPPQKMQCLSGLIKFGYQLGMVVYLWATFATFQNIAIYYVSATLAPRSTPRCQYWPSSVPPCQLHLNLDAKLDPNWSRIGTESMIKQIHCWIQAG